MHWGTFFLHLPWDNSGWTQNQGYWAKLTLELLSAQFDP